VILNLSFATDRIQLLVHGDTYTSSYWTFPYNGFQNYSYVALSCQNGLSSFAFDMIGAGLSTLPTNSTDIQLSVAGNITATISTMLKNGTIGSSLGGKGTKFPKVVAIGHSLGAVTLNWVAVALGSRTPFDAFVSTGHVHYPDFLTTGSAISVAPAAVVNPARWGRLDSGYITTPNIASRALFYSPNNTTFSSQVLMLDEITKDLGSAAMSTSLRDVFYAPATGYTGPVAVVVGSDDQLDCENSANDFRPCNTTGILAQERPFYPDSQNLTVFVIEKTGHDLNLHFSAKETFRLFNELVMRLV
jgi:pimeloyl-ACP methyl ester carboxylesterase